MKIQKIIMFFLFQFITMTVYSQEIDSANILFKAKMLSLQRKGLREKQEMITDLDKTQAVIIESPIDKLILIKVSSNEIIYREESTIPVVGKCFFYLAFYIDTFDFYRLSGFVSNDYKIFFDDIGVKNSMTLASSSTEIDFLCLYNNYTKRKKKKHVSCGCICEERLSEYFKTY